MLAMVFTQAPEAMTWRGAAERLATDGHLPSVGGPSELRLIRATVENMAKAGELLASGQVRVAGSRRPMTTFMPAAAADGNRPAQAEAWASLANALRPNARD